MPSEALFMWRSQQHLTIVLRVTWQGLYPNKLTIILSVIPASLYQAVFLMGAFDPHQWIGKQNCTHPYSAHTPRHTLLLLSTDKDFLFYKHNSIHPTHSFFLYCTKQNILRALADIDWHCTAVAPLIYSSLTCWWVFAWWSVLQKHPHIPHISKKYAELFLWSWSGCFWCQVQIPMLAQSVWRRVSCWFI